MASSSSSPSAEAFSSQLWKYHVFLSFRGEDTRKTFVDHLYTALEQQGIHTYKDDETLPRGESIGPSLVTAIEESQIAVIIFSKNYAESSWCLDELVHIMKCKDTRGQIVMPIFYGVDPSEVRKQKRKYGEAFVKHELENKKKVESWRKALVDASNISGWETQYIANGHESKCIKEIVDTVSHRLHPIYSSVDDNLVGVEARMQDLVSKLQIGFGGKRMIGIWGVGGSGKTTLASSIYDEISNKFDGCCFVANIREESSKNDLKILQKQVLCGVLKQKQEEIMIGRVEEGRRMIKDRLHHKKVLIVLDDVDSLGHLVELAGSRDWFGEGSRIIITTRDEHVLKAHKVDLIHNISLLNKDEAMKLFCKHALGSHRPMEDYELLSKDVVSYAGGLPLALTVLGRFLCDKEMNEWRSALARLKEIPDANILEVLKISFDGLTLLEKNLFLDIACFFRRSWRYKDKEVVMILDACGFHPVIGLKVLAQKALITISEDDGTFDMHDLVQEMGHYIVREKHPKNPEKHSRVWKKDDFLKICAMDATTNLDKIEAIDVRCLDIEERRVLQVVANMKKLRWIDLIPESFPSTELSCQISDSFRAKQLPERSFIMPESFPSTELSCLILRNFRAKQLWEGNKFLPNLRMIKIEFLSSLIKTPDFSGLRNLERFMVKNCMSLEEIHPSFGNLEKLVFVEIQGCYRLKMFPPISRSMALENLSLLDCTSFKKLSKIQLNMENFVPHNMNHIGPCLRKLDLRGCSLADENIRSASVWTLPNLEELNLARNNFIKLNFSFLQLPRLKWLDVSCCGALVELSELPSSIAVVIADGCFSLETLGDILNCKCLWKVSVWGTNERGALANDILLKSMLQGNAKDYFISISLLGIDIWRGWSLPWVNWVKTYNMPLPHDWYNHFSGILMFCKAYELDPRINIIIKHGIQKDFQCELGQKSNETVLETCSHGTHVGYVSFSSLRYTGCLNSTYNVISFSLVDEDMYEGECMFRAVLVPKVETKQTKKVATDCSEFWDEKKVYKRKTFTIQHDSNSSIKILWLPVSHYF